MDCPHCGLEDVTEASVRTCGAVKEFEKTALGRTYMVSVNGTGPFVVGPFGTPWPAAENAADDLTTWIGKTFGVDATKPDIFEADTLEIKLPVCTANPSCGEDDVICPQCKAGNCPGVKCWRGCQG